MKKTLAIILALIMVMSLATSAFAAGEGSITINNAHEGTTYNVYKILDLESYDTVSGAYSYKVNSAWTAFFATDDAKEYFKVDSSNYATYIAAEDDATVAAFAKLALKYAKDNGIAAVDTKVTAAGADKVVFTGLDLGYYLVDSSLGALCGLTTTNPAAFLSEKNVPPVVNKQVKEDSTGNWGKENTADIGQIIEFRATINVHAGAESYIFHDEMSAGLTFDPASVVVAHVDTSVSPNEVVAPTSYYTVKTTGLTDDCTFEVVFTEAFCNHLDINDKVIVYYSAMLNRDAVIAGTGNPNECVLEYGDDNYTESSTTITYTFGIDIVKTDSQNKLIDGAEFKIYDAAVGGNEIAVVPLMDEDEVTPVLDANGNPMYRRARADETGVAIVVKDGHVTVVGFDNGEYYLAETKTPEGYNQLASRQKFIIADANLESVFNDDIYSVGSGVHVVNKSGTMLPEPGGMGTTMFYIFGPLLAAAAVVMLVTKKRMSVEA